MTSTPSGARPGLPGPREADALLCGLPVTDLKRFWPSRRGHAFDEFCR
ncbi:MAG TPA: hypothetical protein VNA11_03895 [Pseudonocardia sp.]|nr:hypothetical protein [Pseudonocardia sp.]